ncbi:MULTISPECIES: alpha/beta fold hydrolase [Ectothiorhodospira]|uniref:alpha/beta fold hydrolase n=1 Tax=Ectothiorhodospira TaxID=1051 RepID=UPI001EE89CE9|nr:MULTISPECIES: alpha/beta hydrolase [Ectothiorhodospira]MCG5493701.1 alpha/beta hydrolase [Ectothiorhodospira variabilis]MCG5505239.1 alpha/beta hydrolase [Ectothiorhodospira variabilis]MCG5508400.1 alpha/beta hydrolase [Ectothiorhodospira variabilis]MCG5526019.1 alpha/beta hydrolase [Ectothiorhodospira haloalkaliphila]
MSSTISLAPHPAATLPTHPTTQMAEAATDGTAGKAEASAQTLPPALTGERRTLQSKAGSLCYYHAAPKSEEQRTDVPLLLIHSVNAAGSAYEVKPLYDHYAKWRPVYALELPGFGGSDRSDRAYTPRLMTDAIHAMVEEIQRLHGEGKPDAIALSLGSEFLARAAHESPDAFRSIGLVSPTGFKGTGRLDGPAESTRGMPWLHTFFVRAPWSQGLFNALTKRSVIRYFLNKAWGSKDIDLGLLEYSVATTRQPGAKNAPYHFLAGNLFSADITTIYESLKLPVFMVHGERGDFVDFKGKAVVAKRPNWLIYEMPTGALPYFEMPESFVAEYEAFLQNQVMKA